MTGIYFHARNTDIIEYIAQHDKFTSIFYQIGTKNDPGILRFKTASYVIPSKTSCT